MVNKCYNVANVEVDEASTVDVDDGSLEEGVVHLECTGPSVFESLTRSETHAENEMRASEESPCDKQ